MTVLNEPIITEGARIAVAKVARAFNEVLAKSPLGLANPPPYRVFLTRSEYKEFSYHLSTIWIWYGRHVVKQKRDFRHRSDIYFDDETMSVYLCLDKPPLTRGQLHWLMNDIREWYDIRKIY